MWYSRDKNELDHIGTRINYHFPEKILTLRSISSLNGEIISDIHSLCWREKVPIVYYTLYSAHYTCWQSD